MATERKTVIARGKIDLSRIPKEEFNPEIPLRVVVTHEEQVLGSTLIRDLKGPGVVNFSVEFEPIIDPNIRIPCPVRFIVGPDLADRELLALDVAYKNYDFVQKSRPAGAEAGGGGPTEGGGAKAGERGKQRSGSSPTIGDRCRHD